MKKVWKRMVSGLLAVMLLSSTCLAAANTSNRASEFFSSTAVWCKAQGNGKITVDYDIVATKRMDKLGVLYVTIFEQKANSSWREVKTYDWNNVSSGLTESNVTTTEDRLWYQGVKGAKYYAEVGCYAELGTRSAVLAQTTRTITAT